MKLYYSPGSCALGIHILLEEIGKPFEISRVDFANRAQYGADYLAVNPKSKVPALQRDDGSTLTEYQAISVYLALNNPAKALIPADIEAHARMMEAMDYVVGTIHALGFTRFWRPAAFVANEAEHSSVKARGMEIYQNGLRLMDQALVGKTWIVGDFSLADPALFYVSWWGATRLQTKLPSHIEAHYRRMLERPSVQKALRDEGF